MRGLWLKIVMTLAISLVASSLLTHLLVRSRSSVVLEQLRDVLLASGLGALHRDLRAAPGHEDEVVEAWRHRVGPPLVWAPLPEPAPSEPWAEWRGLWIASFDLHLPVGDRQLVVGPYTPPQPSTATLGVWAGGITLIVFAAAALVAVPLARRLGRLDRALSAVEAGDLSMRVADPTPDLVGHLAAGFNHMAGALERRVRDREELLQAVTHEYGTPLARLSVRLELLAKRLPAEHADRVEGLRVEIAALDALTAELVEWVALDAPHSGGEIARPADVIREAIAAESDGSEVRVEVDLPADVPPVRGEARDLRRAVANVVRNAQRYAVSRVGVAARVDGRSLVLAIDDDGPGIPAEARDRVVEPFVRLEPSRDRGTGGVGLGLAIARRCAEKCGGTLAIEAREPSGTRVVLRLPTLA